MPLSTGSWNCSFGRTDCSALWMMAFYFVALLVFLVLCSKIPPPLEGSATGSEKGEEFAAVGRRRVIVMVEVRVGEAVGRERQVDG